MAAANPLEDILNSEVDESAISAVVGSLESSLLSPTIKASTQNNSGPSTLSNHSQSNTSNAHELHGAKTAATVKSSPHNANNKARIVGSSSVVTVSTDALVKSNATKINHNGSAATPKVVTIGSTNIGTVSKSKPSDAVDQKPDVATLDVKPQMNMSGQPIKTDPDVKPVVYSVVRPSTPQNAIVKQEGKVVPNTVSTSGLKTSTITPASTSVITLTRPLSTPQTVTVVRQPLPAGTTVATPASSIQIVTNSVMTPRAVTTTAVQKTLAPRTMPMQTPVRIAASPQQNAITIPQPIPPGMVLMRDPQGQIVMVHGQVPSTTAAPAPSQPVRVQSVRLSTAPGTQVIQPHPQVVQASTANPHATTTPGQVPIRPGVSRHPMIAPNVPSVRPPVGNSPGMQPGSMGTAATLQQKKQDDLENVRKCKNFLSTLLRLAASQPPKTVGNVKALIQGLIESRVDPENFTQQLQVELKSSPQPYLVPFLKKSLPLLRQSMINGKMKIDGIAPPAQLMRQAQAANVNPTQPGVGIQARPTMQPYQMAQQQGVRPGVPQQRPQQPMVMVPGQQQQQQRMPMKMAAKPGTKAKPQLPLNAAAANVTKDKRKYDSLKEDDDINDVATMGGVNLTEESRNILATSSDILTGQMRSCQDQALFSSPVLGARLSAIVKREGLDDLSPDVIKLISHAAEERLRSLLEKLAVVAEHRLEIYKMDKRYEVSKEVRPQVRFLEELDKLEKKRHEEAERVVLLRAAKSRSKHEDPEHLKLKEKAKAMQQAELEQMRQREANMTALAAIGPRKKRKVDGTDSNAASPGASTSSAGPTPTRPVGVRPRIKRVNLRDLIFVLEQERELNKSHLLFKTFLK